MTASPYPCPCCGYLTFAEPPGSYDICEICYWEDDALQLEFATTLAGGANSMTLEEAQRAYTEFVAKAPSRTQHTRPPAPLDRRDPEWRPIDRSRDDFADWALSEANRVPEVDERLYYWRPTFWRRARAT
jgi:hypothetical protein